MLSLEIARLNCFNAKTYSIKLQRPTKQKLPLAGETLAGVHSDSALPGRSSLEWHWCHPKRCQSMHASILQCSFCLAVRWDTHHRGWDEDVKQYWIQNTKEFKNVWESKSLRYSEELLEVSPKRIFVNHMTRRDAYSSWWMSVPDCGACLEVKLNRADSFYEGISSSWS